MLTIKNLSKTYKVEKLIENDIETIYSFCAKAISYIIITVKQR